MRVSEVVRSQKSKFNDLKNKLFFDTCWGEKLSEFFFCFSNIKLPKKID